MSTKHHRLDHTSSSKKNKNKKRQRTEDVSDESDEQLVEESDDNESDDEEGEDRTIRHRNHPQHQQQQHHHQSSNHVGEFTKSLNSVSLPKLILCALLAVGGVLIFVFVIGPLTGLFAGLSGLGKGFGSAAQGLGDGISQAANGTGAAVATAVTATADTYAAYLKDSTRVAGALTNVLVNFIDPGENQTPDAICCTKYSPDFLTAMIIRGLVLLCNTACPGQPVCQYGIEKLPAEVYKFPILRNMTTELRPFLNSCCSMIKTIYSNGTTVLLPYTNQYAPPATDYLSCL